MFQIFSSSAVSPSLSASAENGLFSSGKWTKALISQAKTSFGVGLALAVGSAAWIAQYNSGPQVNLNLSNFEWVGEVQLAVAQTPEKSRPFWQVSEGQQLFDAIPSVAKEVAQVSNRRRQVLAAFRKSWKRPNPVMVATTYAPVGDLDETLGTGFEAPLSTSQAAPRAAVLVTPETDSSAGAAATELAALRNIHFHIQQQLRAALDPSSAPQFAKIEPKMMDTHTDEMPVAPDEIASPPKAEAQAPEAPTPPAAETDQVSLSASHAEPVVLDTQPREIQNPDSIQKAYDQILAQSSALQAREGLPERVDVAPDLAKPQTDTALAMQAPPLNDWVESPPPHTKTSKTAQKTAAAAVVEDSRGLNSDSLMGTQAAAEAIEYPSMTEYSQPAQAPVRAAMNTQPKVVPAAPAPSTRSATQNSALDRAQSLVDASLYGPNPDPSILAQPTVVEAFHWDTLISGSVVSQLTHEGSDQSNLGWQTYKAPDHWSTLVYNTADTTVVPLLNQNTAAWLALKAGAELQPSTSIIFGKIPNNWSVQLSGRSENVLILDGHGFPIGNATAGDRYFAFVNAEPGGHLVYLAQGSQTVAVGAVGSAGSATYLDLTRINTSSINGRVLDGSAASAKGLDGIQVHVVGQPGTTNLTGSDGSFNLDAVLTVGNYPIYCETEGTSGFTHRYQVQPTNTQNVKFVRYGEAQVGHWIEQLEGGVSPESGLIVASTESLVNASVQKGLTPESESFVGDANLSPETYALMPNGEIRDNVLLRDGIYDYVSVQVPEGANVTELQDNNGHVFWSELFFSSPGVINVISH